MMTVQPATFDRHRRLPAQKATQVRRLPAEIEENEQFLRARKEELKLNSDAKPATSKGQMIQT
jgi:hypothetical protein